MQTKWSSVQTENTIIQYNECFIYITNKNIYIEIFAIQIKKYGTKEITIPRFSIAKLKDYVKKIVET